MNKTVGQRGDTLIEVLVSIAVLGALVAISYAVMTSGYASSQNSLDRTSTQALINGQASMLRAAHAKAMRADNPNSVAWNTIVNALVPKVTTAYQNTTIPAGSGQFGTINPDGCSTSFSTSSNAHLNRLFYMEADASTDSLRSVTLSSQGITSLERVGTAPKVGDGIWIEGHTYDSVTANTPRDVYVFYIKSCWTPLFGSSPVKNQLKTVVRLYAPQN